VPILRGIKHLLLHDLIMAYVEDPTRRDEFIETLETDIETDEGKKILENIKSKRDQSHG